MSDYPHTCPLCSAPAYLGAYAVKCSARGCKHYEKPAAAYEIEGTLKITGLEAWIPQHLRDICK